MKPLYLLTALAALAFPAALYAQTPSCDALTGDAKKVAQEVMRTAYPYDCCDDTIAACIAAHSHCTLPARLANETCRLAAAGTSARDIRHILDQRALTMASPDAPAKIALEPGHLWGNPDAKVVLSIYLCGRCPYCSRHVPALVRALEQSPLRDKVALNLRLFPIKSHDNSTPAALAIEAAAQLGKAWPFLLSVYEHFDSYSNENLVTWARELGIDETAFASKNQDAAVRDKVITSKKEGLTNGVESTPTFFLNGHRVLGTFDVESMISMLEEAAGL